MMIPRRLVSSLASALAEAPAVALLGPRQVGKTTLALELSATRPAVYLDLESEADRAKLSEPQRYLAQHADKLVILDESSAHRSSSAACVTSSMPDAGAGRARVASWSWAPRRSTC